MQEHRLILGGPGTGKTHALLKVLAEELKETPAERIAYVSYTRQGTYQGVALAKEKFDFSEDQCQYFRTLHSIAFRVTETDRNTVMSLRDYAEFYRHVNVDRVETYMKYEEMQRNNTEVAAMLFEEEALDPYTAQFVSANYKEFKRVKAKKDFSDLLEEVIERGIHLPIDIAIIDEAQDLTTLQWKAVRVLFMHAKRIHYAGDPNQSIYDWAGADYKYLMNMNVDDIKVLEHTHRLPRSIWLLGKKIHAMIDVKTPYPTTCKNEPGVLQVIDSAECVPIRKDESYLFLARANCYLKNIEVYLRSQGYLYLDSEGEPSFAKKKLAFIKALFDYKWRKGYSSSSQKEAMNRFFTDDEIKELVNSDNLEQILLNRLDWEDGEYYVNIGIHRRFNDNPNNIRVASMHKVKGAEADNVYCLLDATKKTTLRFQEDPDAELRVLYVAVTRAKKRLYIVTSNSKYGYPVEEIGQGVFA